MPKSQLPEAVRRVAALAQNKEVKVSASGGDYRIVDESELPDDPSTADIMLALVREHIHDKAVLANMATRMEALEASNRELMSRLSKKVDDLTQRYDEALRAIGNLDATMRLPVQPVRDAKGRMIGAQRVDRLDS